MALLDQQVLTLDVAQIVQALAEGRPRGGNPLAQAARREIRDPVDSGLLAWERHDAAAGEQAKSGQRQAALQELTAAQLPHGITSVACCKTDWGMVSPMA